MKIIFYQISTSNSFLRTNISKPGGERKFRKLFFLNRPSVWILLEIPLNSHTYIGTKFSKWIRTKGYSRTTPNAPNDACSVYSTPLNHRSKSKSFVLFHKTYETWEFTRTTSEHIIPNPAIECVRHIIYYNMMGKTFCFDRQTNILDKNRPVLIAIITIRFPA